MELTIRTLNLKSHKSLIISGRLDDVKEAAKAVDGQRLAYNMDYADFNDNGDGTAAAEFIAHRKHHKKAADFIRKVISNR